MSLVQSAHVHAVKTAYRKIIKLQLDWVDGRDEWYPLAADTRRKFESARSLKDPEEIRRRMEEAERYLKENILSPFHGLKVPGHQMPPLSDDKDEPPHH